MNWMKVNNKEDSLKKRTTAELVAELEKREGVEKTIAEPYKDARIEVNGPAIVLTITD